MNKQYNICLNEVTRFLNNDVSWRFTYIDGVNHEEIYKYLKKINKITMVKSNMVLLKENSQDLFDLINYRWGLILETFNSSPRINKKVIIIDEIDIKRNSLNKYKKFLDIERKCFICGKKIDDFDLSIDHVIPWSYLYSDDLWNLIYVHRSCNSIKSNIIPSELSIEKLKERNNRLLKKIQEKNIDGKEKNELKLAIDKDYVYKFWIGCRS